MPSTLTAVIFIFLQLASQNIGCYAESHYGQGSNLWDTIKKAVSKASELLMYGIKIVGYVVDAICLMCAGLKSCCAGGMAVIDTIIHIVSGAPIGEILMYGMKIVGYVVDALGLMCAGLRSCCAGGMAVIDTIKETVSGTSISEILGWIWYGVKTALVSGAAMLAGPFVLTATGFGAGGIAARSMAAWFQSVWFGGTIGGITGWMFSALQSIGAAGLGAAGMTVITCFSGFFQFYHWRNLSIYFLNRNSNTEFVLVCIYQYMF